MVERGLASRLELVRNEGRPGLPVRVFGDSERRGGDDLRERALRVPGSGERWGSRTGTRLEVIVSVFELGYYEMCGRHLTVMFSPYPRKS